MSTHCKPPTNWYHTLSVVVEVLEHHLAQRIYFTAASDAETTPTHAVIRSTNSYSKAHVLIIPLTILFLTKEASLLFQASQ